MGGRPPGVWHWLDGPEVILAGRAGQESPEALEVRVVLGLRVDVRLEVDAVTVALPEFDDRVANRVAMGVEDPAAQMRHVPHGGSDGIVDDEQVIVGIERQLGRVIWPFLDARRAGQFLGEGTAGCEGRGAEGERAEKSAAAGKHHGVVHRNGPFSLEDRIVQKSRLGCPVRLGACAIRGPGQSLEEGPRSTIDHSDGSGGLGSPSREIFLVSATAMSHERRAGRGCTGVSTNSKGTSHANSRVSAGR